MAGDTLITVVGNLTGDPELRFTPSGAAVANFTVASTPRSFDRQSNEWKDGETLFMRCSVWREAAESVAESLHRGDRVIVTGRLVSRSWDDKETGQKRSVMEMQVDEVGPSLKWATAKVTKGQRSGGGGGGYGGGQGQDDPWATGGSGMGWQPVSCPRRSSFRGPHAGAPGPRSPGPPSRWPERWAPTSSSCPPRAKGA